MPVAVVVVALVAFLAWSFRPAASVDPGVPGVHGQRAILIDASGSAALVQLASAAGPAQAQVVAWARTGERLWSNTALNSRVIVACVEGCQGALGSSTSDSFTRPEVADPPVLLVDRSGARPAAGTSRPRDRVLWASTGGNEIVSSADQLGTALSIDSIAGSHRTHLVDDAGGDALTFVQGSHGALLFRPDSGSAAVVMLARTAHGWQTDGSPVTVPPYSGGCFGVYGSGPALVTYAETTSTIVQGGRARAIASSPNVGECALAGGGPVLASFNGMASTQLRQVGLDGTTRWTRAARGTAELSAVASRDRVAIADAATATVTFVDGRGRVVATRPGVAARIVGADVVLLAADGRPSWMLLP